MNVPGWATASLVEVVFIVGFACRLYWPRRFPVSRWKSWRRHAVPAAVAGPLIEAHRREVGARLPEPFAVCPTCEVMRPVELDGLCAGCGAVVFVRVGGVWELHDA